MTVVISTCSTCGAAVLGTAAVEHHDMWHRRLATALVGGEVHHIAEPVPSPEATARRVRQEVEHNMGGRFSPEDRVAVEEVVAEIADEARDRAEDDEAEGPPPERHPQIPEDAWGKLNREQKEDVAARMDKIAARNDRLSDPDVTQTDRDALGDYLVKDIVALADDYGITLLPAEDLERADETGDNGPPPRPITSSSGLVGPVELRRRRRYLLGKAGLPAEAERSRREELAEIERRLGVA